MAHDPGFRTEEREDERSWWIVEKLGCVPGALEVPPAEVDDALLRWARHEERVREAAKAETKPEEPLG